MNRSWYGYNVIGNGASLRTHLLRLQSTSVFYMDAWGEANWAAQNLPNTVVIHRVFKPEEDTMHRTPGRVRAHLQERASEGGDNRVYRNLGTEPHIADDNDLRRLVDEYLLALQWAKSVGLRVAAPHFAHYGLSERHWPIIEPLTSFIAGNADMALFTCDEYAAGHSFSGVLHPGLPGGNEAGHIQPETWRASPVPYYYHVGRITNLFRWLKANGKPLPRTVITEAGMDALGDVTAWRSSLIKSPGYSDIRGWLSLTEQWKQWYGNRGWSPERAYVEMLVAAWREIYKPWPNIVGACLYCWGTNNDRQWDQFRLDGATEFQSRLESTSFDLGGTPPVTTYPTPIPKPTDAGTSVRVRNTSADSYRVRAGNGTNYAQVGGIARNAEVTIYPATKREGQVNAGKGNWVYVEGGSGEPGWTADDGQFAPVVVFGEPTVQYDVPFQTQRATGINNCGESALTSLLNYWLDVTERPGQVMMEDVVASVNNAGSYATLAQLKTAAAKLGLTLDARTNLTLAFARAELDANRPFIALVERGKLPGTQDYYAFTGAHYVTLTGYGDGFVTVHDPLSLPGGDGVHLKVADADFTEAWRKTTGNDSAFQALVAPVDEWKPITPPEPEDPPPPVVTPIDVLKEQVWAALDAWMEADKAAGEAIAEASLKAAAFKSLHAQYMALKQESAAPELTLVKDAQGEAA